MSATTPSSQKGVEPAVATAVPTEARRKAPRAPARRRRRASQIGWNLAGLLLFVILVFPVYWMITSAFKPEEEIDALHPTLVPKHPTVSHFTNALHRPFFWTDVKNTLIIVSVTVVISMAVAFFAAVALAKFRFSGRKLFIVLMIGIQMLPTVGLVIPLYIVLARYHQVNALTGVIVTQLTFVLPFCVWTMRGFIIGIPRDLEEAAMVDGNSRLGAFVKILLPLVGPGLVATSLFAFITTWNEFIFASTLLSDQSKQTVTVWLSYFYGLTTGPTPWGDLMAASTLIALPAVVFFLIVQRKIAFGLTAGAVKA
ncbi:MAG: carbohydrate ABC transporter permease [Gaiellaceae bacterium]